MKFKTLLRTFAGFILIGSLTTAHAQDKGYWRAASNTARSITGDISLGEEKIVINFIGFPMVKARTLEKAEISALFDVDSTANGDGSLYHLTIPTSKKFLNKNTLCGAEDIQWMVTYVSGKAMRLAFFSSQKVPILTRDAISQAKTSAWSCCMITERQMSRRRACRSALPFPSGTNGISPHGTSSTCHSWCLARW